MTRKFKMAGVLMAVVAMFALTASAASATFTSTINPNSGTGTSTGDVFTSFGSTVTCTNNEFHVGKYDSTKAGSPGKHVEATFPTETLTVVPTYSKCTAFGFPATVNFTGCDYVFHSAPGAAALTVDLNCPPEKRADVTVYSSSTHATVLCHVTVTPFTAKGGLTATTSGKHVNVKGEVTGIVAHQVRTSFLCPAGTEDKAAKYKVQEAGITISGTAAGSEVSVS